MVGPDMLNTRTEKDLKAQIREIREIAVLSVDPVQFSGLKQDQGESFQKYKSQNKCQVPGAMVGWIGTLCGQRGHPEAATSAGTC